MPELGHLDPNFGCCFFASYFWCKCITLMWCLDWLNSQMKQTKWGLKIMIYWNLKIWLSADHSQTRWPINTYIIIRRYTHLSCKVLTTKSAVC
jgi:hypothetical protein